MKGKRKLILWITAVVFVFFILPMGIAYFIYQDTFGLRYTTSSYMKRQVEEFEGLKLKKYFLLQIRDKKQFFEVDKGLMEKIVSFYDES